MKTFDGHRSHAAWSVSMWLSNDPNWYNAALFSLERAKQLQAESKSSFQRQVSIEARASVILIKLLPERTPDGTRFTKMNLKLALEGISQSQQSEAI
jgi:hypothetical protein